MSLFGRKARLDLVLSHWYAPVPNFSASTQDFYAAIEQQLKDQKVPGLTIYRVEFSEGGLLSDKRQYLRMTRQRLVFDICAAPFGTNYFYSCRFSELPSFLARVPVIGPLFERFFRTETYYRQDTRLMYLTVVEGVVKKMVEEETAAKGVKLLTEYEYAPILGELYRPSTKTLKSGVVPPPALPSIPPSIPPPLPANVPH